MSSPERTHHSAERTAEIERAAAERAAELRERSTEGKEKAETHASEQLNEARIEAEKQALPAEHHRPAVEHEAPAPITRHSHDPDQAYAHTMETIQAEMSAPARAFSKVIHNKTVEKVSDVAGSTIARPNAILSGSICAFVLVLALYIHARYIGYALSGFETIATFLLGWFIGIVFDFIRVMVRGKN